MLKIDNQRARSRQQLGLDQIQAFFGNQPSDPVRGVVLYANVDWRSHVWQNQVATKRLIGVVPQRPNLDFALTGKEILLFHAACFGVTQPQRQRRAAELLERMRMAVQRLETRWEARA